MPVAEQPVPELKAGALTILAIETSCDESAVAIIRQTGTTPAEILCSLVSSQIQLHRSYGGVVPEVASRNHSLILRSLVEQALDQADLQPAMSMLLLPPRGPDYRHPSLLGIAWPKLLLLRLVEIFSR